VFLKEGGCKAKDTEKSKPGLDEEARQKYYFGNWEKQTQTVPKHYIGGVGKKKRGCHLLLI